MNAQTNLVLAAPYSQLDGTAEDDLPTIISEQPRTVIRINENYQLEIRQTIWPDDDQVVVFNTETVPALLQAIERHTKSIG